MWKGLQRKPGSALPATESEELSEGSGAHLREYRPAIDARAQRLIARIQRDHNDTEAVLALKEHYARHDDLPSLANLMEGWAQTLRDDRSAADAYAEAAHAVLHGLDDRQRAEALFVKAIERDPSHREALDQRLAMLEAEGDDAGIEHCLHAVAGQLTRRLSSADARADVHYRLGRHYEQRLGLPARAIAEYRSALELDPQLVAAIRAAREIYLATGKVEAAAAMYELEIAAVTDTAAQHALLRELAEHLRHVSGDLDGAVLSLRRALKALPNEPSSLERLAELLAERAGEATDAAAEADRGRAAELYFQAARCVPRSDARARLLACRTLAPSHARAARMLAELDGYGAPEGPEPVLGFLSQAELEALDTGVYAVPPAADVAEAGDAGVGIEPITAIEDDELVAWLEDEAVELIDEDVAPSDMVPITERPPAPTPKVEVEKPGDTLRMFPD